MDRPRLRPAGLWLLVGLTLCLLPQTAGAAPVAALANATSAALALPDRPAGETLDKPDGAQLFTSRPRAAVDHTADTQRGPAPAPRPGPGKAPRFFAAPSPTADSPPRLAALSFGAASGLAAPAGTPTPPKPLHLALAPPPAPPAGAAPAGGTAAPDTRGRQAGRRRSVLQRKRNVPPFWIYQEYDTHTTRAIPFPPLFVHKTPKQGHPEKLAHADLSLTFGWYSRSSGRRRWFNPVFFFGGFSERKTVWGSAPLLMGYRRVGEQYNFGQFPLIWAWGTKFVKNFLFVPFHYQQKAPDGFRGVSALGLFWYGNKYLGDANPDNDRRHFVAAPVFWRFRRGLKQFDFAFLYIGGFNKLKGLDYKAAVPFVVLQQSEFGNRKELWTLGWIRRTDKARRKKVWAIPPVLTFSSNNPDKSLMSATPLFWRSKNHLKGSKFTLAGIVGVYDDPNQRNNFVAPLWYQFRDKRARATTSVLLPIALARKTPDRTAVWTLLGGGARSKNGYGFAVPPLLTFGGKRDDGTKTQLVAGLLWHRRRPASGDQPERDRWVAGPLAYFDRKGQARSAGVLPLLSFFGWGGTKRYQVITPLFWHVRDSDPAKDRRTVVLGPFYHHKTVEGLDGGIPPLFFYGQNTRFKYGIVPALLFANVTNVKEGRTLTLSPVFVRHKGKDSRTLGILGLGWDVRRPNEQHTAVVPFFYRRRVGDKLLTITPLGGRVRRPGADTSVYALFYRRRTENRNGWGVLPLVFADAHPVEGGVARHSVVVPFYLRRRTPTDDLDMWSPLVWRSNFRGERARKGLAVIPLYFRQRQRSGVDVDAGLGFFYSRNRVRRTHTLIAGLGFHRLSRKGINAGVAPLYWWMDSEKKRRLLALPAIFHFEDKAKDSHTTVAVPFWFDRQRANGRRAWGAFPFVFGGKRLHNYSRFSLAPPGYFDIFRLNRNTRFVGFVPFLFRFQKCGFRQEDDLKCRYTLWGSAPLFLAGKDGQGRRTHAAALLYYWDRRPDGWKFYTPLFGINNRPGKTLGWYATPLLGVKTTNTHRRIFALPFWYRKAHRLEDESLTLAVPPLFISRHRKDRRFLEVGLVFWQFRQQHKVATAIVPPVFYHSHSYAQRKVTWLLPLFLRDNNVGKDRALTLVGPGVYTQYRKGEDLNLVQFPLVWHIERGQNQGTFGAFVWWDIRVKGTMVQLVPAAFLRVANPERDTKIIGPGLGWWFKGKGPNEGDRGWRILFGVVGAGVEDGRRYVSVFGARIDRGPAPRDADPAKPKRETRLERRKERRAHRAVKRSARQAVRAHRRAKRRSQRQRRVVAR